MEEKVKKILKAIRPQIQLDGGDVKLVGVDEKTGVVSIAFQGACVGCPLSIITLQAGIYQRLKAAIPEITEVVPIEEGL